MGKAIKKLKPVHEEKFCLAVLIHQHVRAAVEQAVHEELAEVLGVELYERSEARRGRGLVFQGAVTLALPSERRSPPTPVGSEL